MTATDLHELVSDWPREAWPEGLDFNDDENGYRPHWTLDNNTREFCQPAHAVLMFEASGLRWLIDHGYAVWQDQVDGMFRVGPWNETRSWEGKTLIEAIDAAIKGAQA